ncbi:MAG: hypothetical protein IJ094_10835 [Bacilli bacterium]|nr:hypothetical protein [Bacilli bacterium]
MTRLENVINDVKEGRNGNSRPWIYNENGKLKQDVLLIDTLDLLEALKPYEVNVSDKFIDAFIESNEADSFYTYNVNAKISNDICLWYKEYCPVIVIDVHLYGDARIANNTFFAIKLDDCSSDMIYNISDFFYNFPDIFHKDIEGTTLTIDFNLFSDTYSVYDYEKEAELGDYYAIELSDLMEALESKEVV